MILLVSLLLACAVIISLLIMIYVATKMRINNNWEEWEEEQ